MVRKVKWAFAYRYFIDRNWEIYRRRSIQRAEQTERYHDMFTIICALNL